MTFCVSKCDVEISTRLFECFLLLGEESFVKVLIRMFGLKKERILLLTDVELQRYIHAGIIKECIE